jgi:hypothetical protein
MFMACQHTRRQNFNINRANIYIENMVKFRYLGTTVTNQNYVHEEVKIGLNLGNGN